MNNQPLQQNAKTNDKERHNTNTNSFNDVPDDAVFTILPFLGLQDMGNLASVNKEFHRIITNAFTNPNMYTAYPGMFNVLCKFWHENRVAFNKWFTLYRSDKIQPSPYGVTPYNQACDYIFHATDIDMLNNALKMVFQNNTDDITQFLLPLVFNANQFALYRRFGNTTLQETSKAQINTWTTETQPSSENTHTLLFCLLFSRDVKFFNGKHQVLNPMLDYAEKNMNEIFGQETIKKYGEGFIKALLQSCRLTLDAANRTKPTAEKINAIRKAFPNIPINFAGADLEYANLFGANLTYAHLDSANLTGANLTGANLTYADLMYADLTSANLFGANLTYAHLDSANLTGADLTCADLTCANLMRADLTGAKLREANLFGCAFSPDAELDGIKINSTALLSVFIDGNNLQNTTTNIWSLNDKMLGAFKLLLPHADIKELELLMQNVKKQISVHPWDFIVGQLKKVQILKLISDEIAKKQTPQKIACEEPIQSAAISEKPKQQNSSAINSTLALPNQIANTTTTTLKTELGESGNHETNLNLTPNQSP